jgi:hypothetical protein
MGGRQPAPDRLEAAQAAEAALREVTRAAHEAIRDLRAATRDARALLDAEMPDQVRARVEEILVPKIEAMSDTIAANVEQGTAAVFNRFDHLADTLLGEVPGEEPLADTVRRYRRRVREAERHTMPAPAVHTVTAPLLAAVPGEDD